MSRYDNIKEKLDKLKILNFIITILPSFLVVGFGIKRFLGTIELFWICVLSGFSLLILTRIFKFVFQLFSPRYARMLKEIRRIQSEIIELSRSINKIYKNHRPRNKGEQFKRAYDLIGKGIKDTEETLAVGMSRENREVFVTCFIKEEKVVRVTASIGSALRCLASDNPLKWKEHMARLDCDEIRQYHNHPDYKNRTCPSPMDHGTSGEIRQILGRYKSQFRSFIIYWNQIREWRILEYNEKEKSWLAYEFDVSSHKAKSGFHG